MSQPNHESTLAARLATILVVLIPLLALYPIVQTLSDWIAVSRVIDSPRVGAASRAYDWIVWEDDDGAIEASYVHPSSPAAKAGLRRGDSFYMLDYQQYFNAKDLSSVTVGRNPGTTLNYTVQRGTEQIDTSFKITRYPTFLYPTSATLWRFSMWGFAIAAFFHLLGLIVAAPLARRSVAALFSTVLIATSALWIVGNLVRIIAIDILGPPTPGGRYDLMFQATTLVSLVGWIAFPVLLVRKVSGSSSSLLSQRLRSVIYIPTVVLGLIAAGVAILGGVGPFALDELVSPILFYASCYIALASALILLSSSTADPDTDSDQWNRVGSAVTLVVSIFAALLIVGVVPVVRPTSESTAGWFVVATQLLSTAPVILVSLATLRYGKLDQVIRRSLVLVTFLGVLFLLFVGGIGIIESVTGTDGPARNIIAGLYTV
ncbi:MAG: PDZ domain-containing protein, partial [Rhodothermales bacterium]|nr:PDZ domain-containing protein [Rhodothermales bacterium]